MPGSDTSKARLTCATETLALFALLPGSEALFGPIVIVIAEASHVVSDAMG